jgi:hypothetical protein
LVSSFPLTIIKIIASRGGLFANYREKLCAARKGAAPAWQLCARNF